MDWTALTDAVHDAVFAAYTEREPVQYRPGGGTTTVEVLGIYRAAFQGVDLGLQAEVASSQPELALRDSELAAKGIVVRSEDLVDVRGETFALADRQPDGEGITTFKLVRARVPS